MTFEFPEKGRVGALISSSVKDDFVHKDRFESELKSKQDRP